MKIGSCHDNELLCYRHFPKDLPLCFVMCSPWQHLWGKQGREYLHGIEDRGSNDLREASYTAGAFSGNQVSLLTGASSLGIPLKFLF